MSHAHTGKIPYSVLSQPQFDSILANLPIHQIGIKKKAFNEGLFIHNVSPNV